MEIATPQMAERKVGRPPARSGGEKAFTARLPVELHRVVGLIAAAQGISLNAALTRAAEAWVKEQPNHKTFERLAREALAEEVE
jgi:hypothetical protein